MQDEESVVETRGREDGQKWVEHRNTYLLHPCESTTTYMLSDNMTLFVGNNQVCHKNQKIAQRNGVLVYESPFCGS